MAQSPRFPAEWEPQSAVLLAWPHAGTDWAERLASVERTYLALVAAIARFEPVLLCVADPLVAARARQVLEIAGIAPGRLQLIEAPYNDTWLRDSGPISLRENGSFRLLDFRFTGWGGKFAAETDDALVERLFAANVFNNAQRQRIDLPLEGGAIETDGAGTLLTTWRCLQHRLPGTPREQLAAQLREYLGQQRVLWLDHGYLEGDDTEAHIDTLARFAAPDAIVYQSCDDPADPHHDALLRMSEELRGMHTLDGRPYRLFALPWADPIHDGDRRLAASYANFLIVNGAVLMPAYGDAADDAAAAVLTDAFPGREIVQVPCRSLLWQNGSLHCLTMQLPEGVANVA